MFIAHFIVLMLVTFSQSVKSETMENKGNTETATLGGGCFWCVEAVMENLNGVRDVISGYSGGQVKNPGYKEVCTGKTGHAEVVQIHFDPEIISFREIVEVFLRTHDPTTINRQGNDVGSQYRSVIFYHDEEQKKVAYDVINEMNRSAFFDSNIVTEISPFKVFYQAEDYHQDYYRSDPDKPYCQYVIEPKINKFKDLFKNKVSQGAGL